MIIEGYVFVPYQGQLRFRFDTARAETEMFFASDRQYDGRLGVHSFIDYTDGARPPTCRELIFSGMRAQYEDKIIEALESHVMQALSTEPDKVCKSVIHTLKMFEQEMPVELTVLLVSK